MVPAGDRLSPLRVQRALSLFSLIGASAALLLAVSLAARADSTPAPKGKGGTLSFVVECTRCRMSVADLQAEMSFEYIGRVSNGGSSALKLCSSIESIVPVSVHRDDHDIAAAVVDGYPDLDHMNYSLVKPGGVLSITSSSFARDANHEYVFGSPGQYTVVFEYRCGKIHLRAPAAKLTATQ